MKNNIVQKKYLMMLLVMLLILFIYFFTSGFFNINSTYADVFSISSSQVIAESDHWKVCAPNKGGLTPYFTCKENKEFYPHVIGFIYLENNSEIKGETLNQYVFYDKHFYIGEKRWYFNEYSNHINKLSFKITWEDASKIKSEMLSTDNLTAEEMTQINAWIKTHDEEYENPINYEDLLKWKAHSMN
ncbi:hypothetical protein [Sinanaerobacter sp. ZZT-01]|uniref:hypothetical protein n=1 Tax=Sinanaerobacter sp. ZZT-01 TaxID=3111540 RepID=UPI002D7A07FB|nr:hypothetical protein [Sinanaerobacter sp. ZZT-01]WRR93318.1 hypothetical protein U5921_15010 [Sinanaerobacter sp. ZZT-01]